MRILVTGGAGFIGSHLVSLLLKKGHKVTACDTFTNFAGGKFEVNLRYRMSLIKGAELIKAKASHPSVWLNKYDIVAHLAGIPILNPKKSNFFDVNIAETEKVMQRARDDGVSKVLFMSSVYAYGKYKSKHYMEDMALDPIESYGITKAAGEYLTRYFFEDRQWVAIRTAGVYGFGDHNFRISRLIVELYAKTKLRVTRGVMRNFIYIDDLAGSMVAAIERKEARGPINLVTETVSLEHFAETAKKYLPKLSWKIQKIPEGELIIGPVNIDKAKKILRFRPRYNIKSGIEDYIKKISKFGGQ